MRARPHDRAAGRTAVLVALLALAATVALAACGTTGSPAQAGAMGNQDASPLAGVAAVVPSPTATGPGWIVYARGTANHGNIRDKGLYIIRPDGTGLRPLAGADLSHPSWSPDGTKLAATEWMTGLFVENADGSDAKMVTPARLSIGCDWSPDGRQLVVSASAGVDVANLVIVNSDGSGSRQLTAPAAAVAYDENPVWSRDGRIFFTRWRQKPVHELADGTIVPAEGDVPSFEICAIAPDGAGLKVVERARHPLYFSLSPDGAWLAVFRTQTRRLLRVASDGSGRRMLLARGIFATSSCWAPDGSAIVVAANEGPWAWPTALVIVNADGSGVRRIPHSGLGWNPDWRAD